MDVDELKYLTKAQEALFDLYKKNELTDVTWVIDSESGDEEYVSAHSSICAISNRLQKLMLSNPAGDNKKRLIKVPKDLTNSLEDFRRLLHFIYTGTSEDDIPLVNYVTLCETFDVPLGLELCHDALKINLESLLESKLIDQPTKSSLQQFFIASFDQFKDKTFSELMLEFFRLRPLTFSIEECLKRVPTKWFTDVVNSGRLWMQEETGYIFFGAAYMRRLEEFLDLFYKSIRQAKKLKLDRCLSMCAPLTTCPYEPHRFGFHSRYTYNFRPIEGTISTFYKYPPNQWKLSSITGYVAKDWDGRRVLAGMDLTYTNFYTHQTETEAWAYGNENYCTKMVVEIPENDVVVELEIHSGWMVDRMEMTTLEGVRLPPIGTSDGGDLTSVRKKDFVTADNPDVVPVALHGFTYSNIKSKGHVYWNTVKPYFSVIDPVAMKSLNPNNDNVLSYFSDKPIVL